MKKSFLCVLLTFGLFALCPGVALPDTVSVDLLSNFQEYDGVTGEVFMSNSPGYTDYGYVFCLNRNSVIYVPNVYTVQPGPLSMGVTLQSSMRTITGLDEAAWIMHTYDPAGIDAQTGAAVQLAIWNVIGQGVTGDLSFKALDGTTVGDMVDAANTAADTTGFTPPDYQFLDFHQDIGGNTLNVWAGDNLQDFLADPVPEPRTVFLFAAGLLALAAWRYRKIYCGKPALQEKRS
jgi:hypothetical protein